MSSSASRTGSASCTRDRSRQRGRWPSCRVRSAYRRRTLARWSRRRSAAVTVAPIEADRESEGMLTVAGLRAGYGGRPVVYGVDLEVWPGEIVAVLGHNG